MVRFLCFSEQAILKAAGSRQALWLGLSFVLLAITYLVTFLLGLLQRQPQPARR